MELGFCGMSRPLLECLDLSLILNSSAVSCGILAAAFLFIVSCFFAPSLAVSPVASELKASIH